MARNLARQAKAMSACRSLLLGYHYYQHENDGDVLFGYPPAFVNGRPFSVTLPSGHVFSTDTHHAQPIRRYPARLAPYVDDCWEILYDHVDPPDRPNSADSESEAWSKLYVLSVFPSFGINATYVGGDMGQHGFIADRPNRGKHVVFRDVEVRSPASLIVFAESVQRGGGDDNTTDGLHLLTPPVTQSRQWHAEGDTIVQDQGGLMGIPMGRFTDRTVTGFFDGHVETLSPGQLDDMRYWRNDAPGSDIGYSP
jgi:hypothetical protein